MKPKLIRLVIFLFNFTIFILLVSPFYLYSQWQIYQTPVNTSYYDVKVVNQNVIWACGVNIITRTTNGGLSWEKLNNGIPNSNFGHIAAVDQYRAWVTAGFNNDSVIVTFNGGLNWILQSYTSPHFINKIIFFNVNTGIFLRDPVHTPPDSSGFFITRNAGFTWYKSNKSPVVYGLIDNCMNALDTNLVWFVSGSKLYKLGNGLDNNWSTYDIDSVPYTRQVLFINVNIGLASNGTKVGKSTNGGINWFVINDTGTGYGCLSFIPIPNTNWVFMNSQLNIRISYDFCNTWQNLISFPHDSIYFSFMDAYDTNSIWLAASGGRLLKYNHEYIGIRRTSHNIPVKFDLLQNFPNPFNSSTLIQYDIPKQSSVTLVLYDIRGKQIRVLVNEQKQVGSYQLSFDASGLSSGVYFYTMRAGDPSSSSGQGFVMAKKMVLIK